MNESSNKSRIISVAVPAPLPNLSYLLPEDQEMPELGAAISVPLRRKTVTGYLVSDVPEDLNVDPGKLKAVIGPAIDIPTLPKNLLRFLRWLANYYQYPLGEVIRSALPKTTALRKRRRFGLAPKAYSLSEEEEVRLSSRGGKRMALIEYIRFNSPVYEIPAEFKNAALTLKKQEYLLVHEEPVEPKFLARSSFPHEIRSVHLNDNQTQAFAELKAAIDTKAYRGFLLRGVTGSGKTEVYLAAAEYALQSGKNVLILVPEISLTPQLLARVHARLGDEIAVLHSGLTDNERTEQWHLILNGTARVVLGARSTIFAPMQKIGLIIVDEEHESAFKQEDRLRYNARDMAIVRAHQEGATVVLGSATPSLESHFQVLQGKLEELSLPQRTGVSQMPKIEVVDMRREKQGSLISGRLARNLTETLEQGKQSILFLNRRGYASFTICPDCGHVPECPNCSVSLTRYEHDKSMQCHYCGYHAAAATKCAECGSEDITLGGLGTESLEIELKERFPEARLVRIDRETTSRKGRLEELLASIEKGEADIIIGTQMIAKGHDFPEVDLAAVINADVTLNIPDFRAAERAFQLFTQVAGRAGRRDRVGRVVLQTYDPGHPCIQSVKKGDFSTFIREELASRQAYNYPPYCRLARILISGPRDNEVRAIAESVRKYIDRIEQTDCTVLGPAPAALHKIQNKYRWNLLVKAPSPTALNAMIQTASGFWRSRSLRPNMVQVDVDPISLL